MYWFYGRNNEEYDAADLRAFQETIQGWYELEWTFEGPFLNLDCIDLTIENK